MSENIQNKEHVNNPAVKLSFKDKITKDKKMFLGIVILVLSIIFGSVIYLIVANSVIKIDKSQLISPSIDVSTIGGGVLEEVYVHNGDILPGNTVLARVGEELIKTKESIQVINARENIGKIFAKGEPVVTVINPNEMRVVGSLEEDKGLSEVRVGQRATFTVDTFGSKQYEGVVDQISPTVHSGDVVFNISDKREVQKFDIKVRFSISKYPELRNGMSAKLTIYKK